MFLVDAIRETCRHATVHLKCFKYFCASNIADSRDKCESALRSACHTVVVQVSGGGAVDISERLLRNEIALRICIHSLLRGRSSLVVKAVASR